MPTTPQEPPHSVTLSTTSEAAQVSLLCEAVHALCLYASGDEKCAMDTQTALAEALNNVIIHSYGNQPGHNITVRWSAANRRLAIEIIDHGQPISHLPEPSLPEPEAEHSRGWWIISSCVDEYFYRTIARLKGEQLLRVGASPEESTVPEEKPRTNILTLLKTF